MRKTVVVVLFVVLYGLVTFFGLGPVLLADGSGQERLLTLLAVLAAYGIITAVLRYIWRRIG